MDLHHAILQADFRRARELIESGASVNSRDEEQRSPLILCCLHNEESWALGVARMLLVYGARVGLCDSDGRTALVYAVLYERLGLTKLFLRALDFDLNHADKQGHTALWYAAQNSNWPIHDLVLQAVRRYGLKMPLSPNTATVSFSGHGERGQGRHRRAVKQIVLDCSSDKRVKMHPSAQPGERLPPLFRKNLPFSPLPANVWAKRENMYKRLKPPKTKPETKPDFNGDLKGMGVEEKGGDKTSPPCQQNWKLDMRSLMEALQCQISPAYRPPARPRLPAALPLKSESCLGPSHSMDALLCQRRLRGRRTLSFDAASDSLLKEKKAMMGAFRRRCSVAVIPMIRLGMGSQRARATRIEDKGGAGEGKGRAAEGRVTPKSPLKVQYRGGIKET